MVAHRGKRWWSQGTSLSLHPCYTTVWLSMSAGVDGVRMCGKESKGCGSRDQIRRPARYQTPAAHKATKVGERPTVRYRVDLSDSLFCVLPLLQSRGYMATTNQPLRVGWWAFGASMFVANDLVSRSGGAGTPRDRCETITTKLSATAPLAWKQQCTA